MDEIRQKRVLSRALRAVQAMLASGELKAPPLITISDGKISSDGAYITFFVMPMDERGAFQPEKVLSLLTKQAGVVQRHLAKFGLKRTPQVVFKNDLDLEKSQRITAILDRIKEDQTKGPQEL